MDAAPQEVVRLDSRRHGIVLARPFAYAVAFTVLGLTVVVAGWPVSPAGPPLIMLGALLALRAVWRWERTRVVVTTEKVYVVAGTVHRRASAVRLRSIRSLGIQESLPGRLFGYGTVVAGPLELDHVARPREVLQLVERLCA